VLAVRHLTGLDGRPEIGPAWAATLIEGPPRLAALPHTIARGAFTRLGIPDVPELAL
jgi:hypothetical protein